MPRLLFVARIGEARLTDKGQLIPAPMSKNRFIIQQPKGHSGRKERLRLNGESMIDRIALAIRPHFAAIGTLCTRDIPMQLFSGLCVCAIIVWQGYLIPALVIIGWLVVSEMTVIRLFHRKAPFNHWTKDKILLTALGLACVNNVFYLMPALYMAMVPSLAIKVVALLWVLGIQVYTVNMWSRHPVFLFALLVPSMMMTVLTVFEFSTTAPTLSTLTEWSVTFTFVFLFIYATIDSLRHHLATERALFAAQAESARRLNQLEENHRLDPLTGLLNRPAFDAALHVMLTDRGLMGGDIAVLLVDLDSFKPINDTYSHEAGDRLLTETARRIRTLVADNGIVGRLGGDEFICAVQDLPGPDAALDLAWAMDTAIRRPIDWNDRTLKINASIGVAMTSDDPTSLDSVQSLCSAADQAMFAAKSSPNSNPVFFDADSFAPLMSPQDKQALIEALSTNAIQPFYQPKIHLPSGRIIGFEALARWRHPDGSLRRPDDFIKQINELGLQGDFMTHMASQVVDDVQTLLDRGLDPGHVSFNVPEIALATLTGRQDLERIVTRHAGTARHLTFEITEDVFIARAAEAIQTSIAAFRALGVRVSLDDFGTGFASFHHLSQLDLDEMKIDTSFVAGLGQDPTADVLVRGFLNIASGLGVSVIAEGVETESQSRDLINMGCVIAQGYLFSPAIPLDQAAEQLKDQQAA